jgi:hypothetical protein
MCPGWQCGETVIWSDGQRFSASGVRASAFTFGTCAHDHEALGGFPDQTRPPLPRLHQVLDEGSAARSEFGPPGSPLATTGDLMNVAKALLTWVATQSPPHRWSDGQLPADLAPQTGRLIVLRAKIYF